MTGIRIVRLGKIRTKKPAKKSKLPVFTEQEYGEAIQQTFGRTEDAIPPGFMPTYDLYDKFGCHGGGGERKIRDMLRKGELQRITLRRYGVDGCIKHRAFYKILTARSSISRTPGSQPEKRGAIPLRAAIS